MALLSLLLTVLFAVLACEAFGLGRKLKHMPDSSQETPVGLDVSHLPLHERQKLGELNRATGVGDIRQMPWAFVLLAVFFGFITVVAFLN